MRMYLIRLNSETNGPIRYEIELSTTELHAKSQKKTYEEASRLLEDLTECLSPLGNAENILQRANTEKSIVLNEKPIALSQDCASRLGWFETTGE
jgi:hypothetical protein